MTTWRDAARARHVLRDHGSPQEWLQRQVPVRPEDFADIPQILRNPDTVHYVGKAPTGPDIDVVLQEKFLKDLFNVCDEIRSKKGRNDMGSMLIMQVQSKPPKKE